METKYLDLEIHRLETLKLIDNLTDNEDNMLIEYRMIKCLLAELKKLRVADVILSLPNKCTCRGGNTDCFSGNCTVCGNRKGI